METVLYYVMGGLGLVAGAKVIGSKNAVESVLYLVLVFVNGAGLLVMLGMEYLGMIFVIVYVGAIAVLFLFVVMMLAPKRKEEVQWASGLQWAVVGVLMLAAIREAMKGVGEGLTEVKYRKWLEVWDGVGNGISNLESVGQVMYTYKVYEFLLAGGILLVAMLGAIVLTLQNREAVKGSEAQVMKRQKVYEQMARDSKRAIFSVSRNVPQKREKSNISDVFGPDETEKKKGYASSVILSGNMNPTSGKKRGEELKKKLWQLMLDLERERRKLSRNLWFPLSSHPFVFFMKDSVFPTSPPSFIFPGNLLGGGYHTKSLRNN